MDLHRDIKKATMAKIARYSPSLKSRSMNYMESILEDDICLLLDFDQTVETFVTQPVSFFYKDTRGYWRRYTPDLLIKRNSGVYEFAEIKPKYKALKPEFVIKHEVHKRVIAEQTGKDLLLLTEPELNPKRLVQLDQLAHFHDYDRNLEAEDVVIDYLGNRNRAKLSELAKVSTQFNAPDFYPMVMLAHQVLRCVSDEVVKMHSLAEVA